MNSTKFHELASKCWEATPTGDFDYCKFGRLVVAECIEAVGKNIYSGMSPSDFSDGADFAYTQAISDIKEYFGVDDEPTI
jgi:hypothetical protein